MAGEGLFIKDSIQFHIREDLSVFIPHVFESVFVAINTNSNKKSIIGVMYKPNTQPYADIDVFTSTLFELMALINSERKSCCMMYNCGIFST